MEKQIKYLIFFSLIFLIGITTAALEIGLDEGIPLVNMTTRRPVLPPVNGTDTSVFVNCTGGEVGIANGTCADYNDLVGAGVESDPVWTGNWSLGYFYNHTSDVFSNWGEWFYNQTANLFFYNQTDAPFFYNMSEVGNLYVNLTGDTMTGDLLGTWFNGSFNWTSGDDYNIFDGNTLTFNTTKLESLQYNATTIENTTGILDAGNLASIHIPEDGDSYNVSEITGASPMTIEINFTGVSSFDSLIGRVSYSGGQGHEIQVEIQRIDTGDWENYLEVTDTTDFVNIYVPVFDEANHIFTGENVSVRFSHFQNGNPNHEFYIDYLNLVDGFTALTVVEHDGLSGRNNILVNHPNTIDVFLNLSGTNANQNIDISPYSFTCNKIATTGNAVVAGALRVRGTLNLDTGSITDISGTIDFDDENLITTGNVTADWGKFTNLNVTGISYLGDLIIEAENITVDNIIPLTGENISVRGNLTLFDRIEFRLGEIIDNAIDGFFRVFANFNMMGNNITNISNIEALNWSNFTGTESQITDLQDYLTNDSSVSFLDVNGNSGNFASATIGAGLTVNADNLGGSTGLTLKGTGTVGTARGGVIEWHSRTGDTIGGYTFTNLANQFVWKKTVQTTSGDEGVASLDFDTGDFHSDGDIDGDGTLMIDGHAAIGNDASVSASQVLSVREKVTATGSYQALAFRIDWEGTSDNTGNLIGNEANIRIHPSGTGNKGDLTNVYAVKGQLSALWTAITETNVLEDAIIFFANWNDGANYDGNIANLYLFKGSTIDNTVNVTNAYGIFLDDITGGTASNHAWKSGLGNVSFGDDVYIDADRYLSGTERTFSPSITCGVEEEVCFGIDFKTKEIDWCHKEGEDWVCDNNNSNIINKLVSIDDRNLLKQEYINTNKNCIEGIGYKYPTWKEYQEGNRDCDFNEEFAIITCQEKEDYNYWDNLTRTCKENLFLKCYYDPIEGWDTEKNICVIIPKAECEYQTDNTWNETSQTCEFSQKKQSKRLEDECLYDRSKYWDGDSCEDALILNR